MDNFEKVKQPLQKTEQLIAATTSLDELIEIIKSLPGPVQGEVLVHEPTKIVQRIEQVRHGHRELNFVTRTYGIRNKVEALLPDDPIYKKYVSNKK